MTEQLSSPDHHVGGVRTSPTCAKVFSALIAAQAEMPAIGKSGDNTYDRYKYSTMADYADIKPILQKHKIGVICGRRSLSQAVERTTKSGGKEYARCLSLDVRVIHESGEWVEFTVDGEGQDRSDKAVYKAITGCRKYGIQSAFNLASEDDPERDGDQTQPPAKAQPTRTQPKREVVDQNTGEVKNAADLPDFSDLGVFRKGVLDAFDMKKFNNKTRAEAIRSILTDKTMKDLSEVPQESRHKLVAWIKSGKVDQYLSKNGKKETKKQTAAA